MSASSWSGCCGSFRNTFVNPRQFLAAAPSRACVRSRFVPEMMRPRGGFPQPAGSPVNALAGGTGVENLIPASASLRNPSAVAFATRAVGPLPVMTRPPALGLRCETVSRRQREPDHARTKRGLWCALPSRGLNGKRSATPSGYGSGWRRRRGWLPDTASDVVAPKNATSGRCGDNAPGPLRRSEGT